MSTIETPANLTESELISRAQFAVSQCNWEVGECAAHWTRRFARGRTDTDFAGLVGLSSDQVYQRRRVWETFADVRQHYPNLKWSHFYVALTWEDAAECLQWALDTASTVAEMRAWRRAQRGEDLTLDGDDDEQSWLSFDPSEVRIPREAEASAQAERESASGQERASVSVPVAAGVARESSGSGDDYAPFSPDAVSAPSAEVSERPRPAPSMEQLLRRLTTTMERCTAAMVPDFFRQIHEAPEKDQQRFRQAARALADKLDEIG